MNEQQIPTIEKIDLSVDGDNLTIGGSLDLSGTQITSLPDNLTVGGSLYLSGTQITSLPDNLTIGGSIYLSGTQITSLPDNLTIGGSIHLSGTQITSLPDNLTVGGSIHLRGTQITSLPDNLTIGGSIYLSGTGDYLIVIALDGSDTIRIGCCAFSSDEWRERGEQVAHKNHQYIDDYREVFELAARWLKERAQTGRQIAT